MSFLNMHKAVESTVKIKWNGQDGSLYIYCVNSNLAVGADPIGDKIASEI